MTSTQYRDQARRAQLTVKELQGYLAAYFETGMELSPGWALFTEKGDLLSKIDSGDHLTVYSPDGKLLWEGLVRLEGGKPVDLDIPYGVWARMFPLYDVFPRDLTSVLKRGVLLRQV